MICPDCNQNNIEGIDECENCGADLRLNPLDESVESCVEDVLLHHQLSQLNPRQAVYVKEQTLIEEAVELMNQQKTGCALVEDKNSKLIGIITERDILKNAVSLDKIKKLGVSKIMTKLVETLNETDKLASAVKLMALNKFRRIPVIRQNQKAAIITTRDVLRYLSNYLYK